MQDSQEQILALTVRPKTSLVVPSSLGCRYALPRTKIVNMRNVQVASHTESLTTCTARTHRKREWASERASEPERAKEQCKHHNLHGAHTHREKERERKRASERASNGGMTTCTARTWCGRTFAGPSPVHSSTSFSGGTYRGCSSPIGGVSSMRDTPG